MAWNKGSTISLKFRKLILGSSCSQAYLRERLGHSRDCGRQDDTVHRARDVVTSWGGNQETAAQPFVA